MSTAAESAIRAALVIERRRSRVLERMRSALDRGDDAGVVRCAKELFEGDHAEAPGDRAPAGELGGAGGA